MTTKYRNPAVVAEQRILELTAQFATIGGSTDVTNDERKDGAKVNRHSDDKRERQSRKSAGGTEDLKRSTASK